MQGPVSVSRLALAPSTDKEIVNQIPEHECRASPINIGLCSLIGQPDEDLRCRAQTKCGSPCRPPGICITSADSKENNDGGKLVPKSPKTAPLLKAPQSSPIGSGLLEIKMRRTQTSLRKQLEAPANTNESSPIGADLLQRKLLRSVHVQRETGQDDTEDLDVQLRIARNHVEEALMAACETQQDDNEFMGYEMPTSVLQITDDWYVSRSLYNRMVWSPSMGITEEEERSMAHRTVLEEELEEFASCLQITSEKSIVPFELLCTNGSDAAARKGSLEPQPGREVHNRCVCV
jgi:hypothetical protein